MSEFNVRIDDANTGKEHTNIEVIASSRFDACKKALNIVEQYYTGQFRAVVI
jgi:hypothetical protein